MACFEGKNPFHYEEEVLATLATLTVIFTKKKNVSKEGKGTSNKNIKTSSFKISGNIQKKGDGPDRSVLDNQSSSVTLNELAMKGRKIL